MVFLSIYDTWFIASLCGWDYFYIHWYHFCFYGCVDFFFNTSLLLSSMFELVCQDTCSFECLICMCFIFFLFVLVQCGWACFTWKGTRKKKYYYYYYHHLYCLHVCLLSSFFKRMGFGLALTSYTLFVTFWAQIHCLGGEGDQKYFDVPPSWASNQIVSLYVKPKPI